MTNSPTSSSSSYPKEFLSAVAIVLEFEGGYVNDPSDPGGETKYGISKRQYPHLDIAKLTKQQAIAIYYEDYFLPLPGESLTHRPNLLNSLLETAVNMGIITTRKLAQRALGVVPDGQFGPKTLSAFKRCDEEVFLLRFTLLKIQRRLDLVRVKPSLKKFLHGWIRRDLGAPLA